MAKHHAIFLDRNGTIIEDQGYLKDPLDIVFYPTKPICLLTEYGNKHKDELAHDIKICSIFDAGNYAVKIKIRKCK